MLKLSYHVKSYNTANVINHVKFSQKTAETLCNQLIEQGCIKVSPLYKGNAPAFSIELIY